MVFLRGFAMNPLQRNRILWVMNVCWVGGTGLWALDTIKTLPRWFHRVVYVNSDKEEIAHEFRNYGIPISKAPHGVTKELVESFDPVAVVLSNTDPSKIEGGRPWEWLTSNYCTIYVHHSKIATWLPGARADIFVSDHLKNQYKNLWPYMERSPVIPPVGDMQEFFEIRRDYSDRCVIGRISSDNVQKFPRELVEVLQEVGCSNLIVGGQKYWPDLKKDPAFSFPDFYSRPVPDMLKDMDIFVYKTNLSETWCRAITEAMASGLPVVAENRGGPVQQIRSGLDGFLCSTKEEFIEKLKLLSSDPALRKKMGMKARERAKSLAQNTFAAYVEPIITDHALGVVAYP